MVDLPPPIGHFTRNRVVVLATGRTAVARVGGVTAIRRHVATAKRLGLEPIVLYAERMTALAAEIANEVDGSARCVPANALADEGGYDDELAMVIAGDWYIAPDAIMAFSNETRGAAVAKLEDRGHIVSPLARLHVRSLRRILPELATRPPAELIDSAAEPDSVVVSLPVSQRHRLSDNVAIGRCEAKLFGWVGATREPWFARLVQRVFAIPLTRKLANTRTTPAHLGAARMLLGLAAAGWLAVPGYLAGILAATLYFLSRVLDTVAADLSRAAVVAGLRGRKVDVIGDIVVLLTIIIALGSRLAVNEAYVLTAVAIVGIAISAWVSYRRLFRWEWRSRDPFVLTWNRRDRAFVRDNFASRFWRRNGPAYALLIAALLGRLDLFLWAAAAASHLFYCFWLLSTVRDPH